MLWFILKYIGASSGVGCTYICVGIPHNMQQPYYISVDTMTTCCLSMVFFVFYFDILHAKYLSVPIYIKEKYRHLRLFSRSDGGGGPLTRKRLFCIIHEFFIRFVHHPPGNCTHTYIGTFIHTYIPIYNMYNVHYMYIVHSI